MEACYPTYLDHVGALFSIGVLICMGRHRHRRNGRCGPATLALIERPILAQLSIGTASPAARTRRSAGGPG